MFPLIYKIIEATPSNNVTYTGGLGRTGSKASKKPLSLMYKRADADPTTSKEG